MRVSGASAKRSQGDEDVIVIDVLREDIHAAGYMATSCPIALAAKRQLGGKYLVVMDANSPRWLLRLGKRVWELCDAGARFAQEFSWGDRDLQPATLRATQVASAKRSPREQK